MFMFLGILSFLLFLVMLVVSINPKWISRGEKKYTRKQVLLSAGVMFVLFCIFAINDGSNNSAASLPPSTSTVTAPVKTPEQIAQEKADADLKAKQATEAAKITDADKALLIKSQYKLFSEDEVKQFTAIEKKYTALADAEKVAVKADFERLSAQKQYQAWIKSQFSVWDGSNTHLVDLIKKNLNDNKSFSHVSTTYVDKADYLVIKMTYRAKNSFGGVILQNVTAKSDYKTNTISVTSQND